MLETHKIQEIEIAVQKRVKSQNSFGKAPGARERVSQEKGPQEGQKAGRLNRLRNLKEEYDKAYWWNFK